MSRLSQHRTELAVCEDRDAYLRLHSGLPGPRANLELVQVVAELATEVEMRRWLSSPDEFLAMCGTVALGRRIAAGRRELLPELRALAADPRWRVREAVAMALQLLGDADMPALLAAAGEWCEGGAWEQRAALGGLCEPRLLRRPEHVGRVLQLLDQVTRSPAGGMDGARRALRQALGYCWSVAVAACQDAGRPAFERLIEVDDRDVRWIVRENLRKARMVRIDGAWVDSLRERADAWR